MATFRVTFQTITEDSAEQGDYAESGYYSRGGWTHDDPSDWTLEDVVSEFGKRSLEDSGRSFSTPDARVNYRTGEDTYYCVHPPRTITPASYARLRRLLCYRS